MSAARHVLVSGRVQGVSFRWATREQAQDLGLHGWVRNLPDGRVEAWIEGDPAAVARMLDWLSRGPRLARVNGLQVEERTPEGVDGFEIRTTPAR